MRDMPMPDWLAREAAEFVAELQPGWLTGLAECQDCGRAWRCVCHRNSMGRLECPDCQRLAGILVSLEAE